MFNYIKAYARENKSIIGMKTVFLDLVILYFEFKFLF